MGKLFLRLRYNLTVSNNNETVLHNSFPTSELSTTKFPYGKFFLTAKCLYGPKPHDETSRGKKPYDDKSGHCYRGVTRFDEKLAYERLRFFILSH